MGEAHTVTINRYLLCFDVHIITFGGASHFKRLKGSFLLFYIVPKILSTTLQYVIKSSFSLPDLVSRFSSTLPKTP